MPQTSSGVPRAGSGEGAIGGKKRVNGTLHVHSISINRSSDDFQVDSGLWTSMVRPVYGPCPVRRWKKTQGQAGMVLKAEDMGRQEVMRNS